MLYSNLAKEGHLILHIDATGGLIKKFEYLKRSAFLLSAVPNSTVEEIKACSVSDCIVEECRVEDVSFWLRRVRCDVARLQGSRFDTAESCPSVVVTDFSWVMLHASVNVFCGTTMIPYLNSIFRHVLGQAPTPLTCHVFSCSSHFLSRAARNMVKFFGKGEKNSRDLLMHCIAALISAPSLSEAGRIWQLMIQVFSHPNATEQWNASYYDLFWTS